MKGTLRLAVGCGQDQEPMFLSYPLLVEKIPGGMHLLDVTTSRTAEVYDCQLMCATQAGGGWKLLTALLVHHVIEQAFLPPN